MSDDNSDDGNEDSSHFGKSVDMRFVLCSFKYKKRQQFDISQRHALPPMDQILAGLNDNAETRFFGMRSASQFLLHLMYSLLPFAMGIVVARFYLQQQRDPS
ncbi:unnamed protein product, partial [Ixodes persulcatus]